MTISLRIDKALERKLNAAAKARGIPKSELVRECIREQLTNGKPKPTAYELGKDLFGQVGSGRSDLSERHSELVGEYLDAKHRRRN